MGRQYAREINEIGAPNVTDRNVHARGRKGLLDVRRVRGTNAARVSQFELAEEDQLLHVASIASARPGASAVAEGTDITDEFTAQDHLEVATVTLTDRGHYPYAQRASLTATVAGGNPRVAFVPAVTVATTSTVSARIGGINLQPNVQDTQRGKGYVGTPTITFPEPTDPNAMIAGVQARRATAVVTMRRAGGQIITATEDHSAGDVIYVTRRDRR